MKKYTKEQLEGAIKSSLSWRQVCGKLNIYYSQQNCNKAKERAIDFEFSFDHFLGKSIWRGKASSNRKDPENLFKILDKKPNTHNLKNRLIQHGYKEHRCEKCKNTEWNGIAISLELHHKNGNNKDNRLENLEVLCCNCHAQTDNYCSKNKFYKSPYGYKKI